MIDYQSLNKEHYERQYEAVAVSGLVKKVVQVDRFLGDAILTDTSWVGMYHGDFRRRLQGATVLELGAGDGLNALIMAKLGARVIAVDLSSVTPRLISEAAEQLGLTGRVEAYAGYFEEMHFLLPGTFDLVIGKAFLHHLTHEVEEQYLRKVAVLLRPAGQARFFEPAVNSGALDFIRWLVPVPGRPSRLSRQAFAEWKASDTHPPRDNSSEHYRRAGLRYFEQAEIVPLGGIERLHRFFPAGRSNRSFRRTAFRLENLLPVPVRMKIARSQLLIYSRPRVDLSDASGRSEGSGLNDGRN